MKYEIVKTTTELLGLYKPPMDLAVNKEMSKLDKHSIKFLSLVISCRVCFRQCFCWFS